MNTGKVIVSIRDNFFHGKVSQGQVDSLNAILAEWQQSGHTDLKWLAYILATVYHETGKTMLPVEEWGKGKGRDYGKKLKMSREPYEEPDKIYFGRGYVQLTWYENYDRVGRLIDQDLLNTPELALYPGIAAEILVSGMVGGWFTGKKLIHYLNKEKTDWKNARKIINGLDRADVIAGHAKRFYEILKAKT